MPPALPDALTNRELAILQLVAQGLSNYDIDKTLSVTETTVRTHLNRIFSKLHITSRTQAALYALKAGLATLETDTKIKARAQSHDGKCNYYPSNIG